MRVCACALCRIFWVIEAAAFLTVNRFDRLQLQKHSPSEGNLFFGELCAFVFVQL